MEEHIFFQTTMISRSLHNNGEFSPHQESCQFYQFIVTMFNRKEKFIESIDLFLKGENHC